MKVNAQKVLELQARTGKTLAELGIPRTTMHNIKRGANVRPQTIYRIASALCCDVTEIIKGGD